jgi:hypothetical protein
VLVEIWVVDVAEVVVEDVVEDVVDEDNGDFKF